MYDFTIVHVAGESNVMKVADAISWHPVAGERDADGVKSIARAHAVEQAEQVDSITWRKVNETAAVDVECVALY